MRLSTPRPSRTASGSAAAPRRYLRPAGYPTTTASPRMSADRPYDASQRWMRAITRIGQTHANSTGTAGAPRKASAGPLWARRRQCRGDVVKPRRPYRTMRAVRRLARPQMAGDALVTLVVAIVIGGPAIFTHNGFGFDYTNHMWMVWAQEDAISRHLLPTYFLNTPSTGIFFPLYMFYGGSLYALTGGLAAVLGGRVVVAFVGVSVLSIVSAYGGMVWLARQLGVRSWLAHAPALAYVAGAYYATNLYGRGAWTEFVATSMLPLVGAAGLHILGLLGSAWAQPCCSSSRSRCSPGRTTSRCCWAPSCSCCSPPGWLRRSDGQHCPSGGDSCSSARWRSPPSRSTRGFSFPTWCMPAAPGSARDR